MNRHLPRIWLVIGDKLGDNAQIDVLAETLGLPTERKELCFKQRWVHGKPPFRASLHHLDPEGSDRLEPPWPDLVITIGRRPAMAALWVKRQSGGRTKLVLIGRPKRYFDEFDLVIATGQYVIPDRPNVLKLELPLMRANPEAAAQAAGEWQERLAEMPRPLTAVLVGGATKPFRFGPEDAWELLRQVQEATGDAGSLYISTSRRTSTEAADAIEQALPRNARLFRWSPQADPRDNPYLALLGTADRFVVTGDSISMMVEVARLQKPLAIAPLPVGKGPFPGADSRGVERRNRFLSLQPGRLLTLAANLGLINFQRDFEAVHRTLRDRGSATYLSEGFGSHADRVRDEALTAAQSIRNLLELGDA